MALSVLIGFGAVFGASEGIRASQQNSRREEHRSRKNALVVHCPKSSEFSPLLEGRQVVLSGDKLYIDTGTAHDQPFGHPFSGYYLPYPDAKYAGLVSTVTDEAPVMNWIYVSRDTHEVKFGVRQSAEPNLTGPFDCTRQDRRLTFGGWEGFVAVREGGFWALYFDRDGDGLGPKVAPGTPVIEVELIRRELRVRKPPPPPPAPPAAPTPPPSPPLEEQNRGNGREDHGHAAEMRSTSSDGDTASTEGPRTNGQKDDDANLSHETNAAAAGSQGPRRQRVMASNSVRGRRGRKPKGGEAAVTRRES